MRLGSRLAPWLAAFVLPALAVAADAPHDSSLVGNGITCRSCHFGSNGHGAMRQQEMSELCAGCHDYEYAPGNRFDFGLTWQPTLQAKPGAAGAHHPWSAPAESAAAGTRVPAHAAMRERVLADGRIRCSTCHDVHKARPEHAVEPHVSLASRGEAPNVAGLDGDDGKLAVAVAADAEPRTYRVRIVDPGAAGVARFSFSVDNAATWSAPLATGAGVAVGAWGVTATFTGAWEAGDEWLFYVGYPFLRASAKDDALCLDCHASRALTAAHVRGDVAFTPGTTVFSHPVNVAMPGDGRFRATILDGNGAPQPSPPGAADDPAGTTNDLRTPGGIVGCTTCHATHNADSNSLTEDRR
jgi:predicted CXXCH cytochrome family protein